MQASTQTCSLSCWGRWSISCASSMLIRCRKYSEPTPRGDTRRRKNRRWPTSSACTASLEFVGQYSAMHNVVHRQHSTGNHIMSHAILRQASRFRLNDRAFAVAAAFATLAFAAHVQPARAADTAPVAAAARTHSTIPASARSCRTPGRASSGGAIPARRVGTRVKGCRCYSPVLRPGVLARAWCARAFVAAGHATR